MLSIQILPLPQIKISAGLVFAGYGISEPGLGYDDYAGLNAKGKIVLIVRGSPDKFSSSVAAHVMNSTQILKIAAEHGAVGVMMCSTDSAARLPNFSRGVYSVFDKQGKVAGSWSYYSDKISVFGGFSYSLFNIFLKDSGKALQAILTQLKAGQPDSFVIDEGINVSYSSTYQDIISYNVIGKITGSDRKLKNTYIVHSAHLDHLGRWPPQKRAGRFHL